MLAVRQQGDGLSGRKGFQRARAEEKMRMEAHSQMTRSSLVIIPVHYVSLSTYGVPLQIFPFLAAAACTKNLEPWFVLSFGVL